MDFLPEKELRISNVAKQKATKKAEKSEKPRPQPVVRKDTAAKKRRIGELAEKPWSVFDILADEAECPYTHVSLFSGCGGFDLGLRAAGFRTLFANDINEAAAQTYRRNLGEILVEDIRTVQLPDIHSPDVLTAGFPCQPFSNAGLRKGTKDARGDLYLSALRAVETLEPKTVVFENVRGLLSSKHEGHRVIEIIVDNLSELGYRVNFSLVNAALHNVGSERLRVLIVGVRRDQALGLGHFAFPPKVERPELALKNIVFDIPDNASNQNDVMEFTPQAQELEKHIPEGGSWKDIPDEFLPKRMMKIKENIVRYHYPKFYRRFDRNEIAGTITASFKPEKAGVFHPKKHRGFSVREVARIQSFPDWFVFTGAVPEMYQQIGNAVPPRLSYEVGCQLVRVLNGEDLLANANAIAFDDFVKDSTVLRANDEVACE